MPEKTYGYIDLPPDPKDLTREHALKVFAHPQVLVEAFARLAAPEHSKHDTEPGASGESRVKSA